MKSARFLTTVVFLALTLLTIITAQNCSPANTNSNASPETKVGGGGSDGGFDGKTFYSSVGDCGSGKDVKSRIGVTADGTKAAVVRDNCRDVAQPITMDAVALTFSLFSSHAIAFNNLVYDLETSTGHPPPITTNIFCKGTDFEVALWSPASAPTTFLGHVTHNDGSSTGDLSLLHTQMTLPGTTRDTYAGGTVLTAPHVIFDLYQSPLGFRFLVAFQTTTGAPEGATLTCATQGK